MPDRKRNKYLHMHRKKLRLDVKDNIIALLVLLECVRTIFFKLVFIKNEIASLVYLKEVWIPPPRSNLKFLRPYAHGSTVKPTLSFWILKYKYLRIICGSFFTALRAALECCCKTRLGYTPNILIQLNLSHFNLINYKYNEVFWIVVELTQFILLISKNLPP